MSLNPTGQHILIVDDKPTNLKVLATTLSEAGFEIAVAISGEMALQLVESVPPQLILLDLLMSDLDGFETCRRLKANPVTQNIPVIFMTALSDTVDKVKGFSLGAVDYITKPFETQEVLARVQTHLRLHFLTKTLEEKNQQLSETIERLNTAQERIIAQEKLAMIGVLTTGIVHELRNPLNFVKNYAEGSVELSNDLLEEIEQQSSKITTSSVEMMKELVNELRENALATTRHANRAENVIQEMLFQSQANETQFQATEINVLLDQAIQLVYKSKYARNVNFKVKIQKNYDQTLGQVKLISSQISRAFINLLDNAFYSLAQKQERLQDNHSLYHPQIWLKTKNLEQAIQIRIRDNGIGIQPDIQDKIFSPFFSTKTTSQGTGLGLYLTHDIIVNQHGGAIQFETNQDVYTEFILEIPMR